MRRQSPDHVEAAATERGDRASLGGARESGLRHQLGEHQGRGPGGGQSGHGGLVNPDNFPEEDLIKLDQLIRDA